jgi:hypothetical protein
MRPACAAEDLADDGSKRLLIGFAAVLFLAGFVVAVIAVLYRPQRIVLVGMDAHETAWLSHALKEYADRHRANLRFVPYRDAAQFDSLLAADRARARYKIVLAETPLERLASLADSNAVIPLRELKGVGDLGVLLADFTAETVGPTAVGGPRLLPPVAGHALCLGVLERARRRPPSRTARRCARWSRAGCARRTARAARRLPPRGRPRGVGQLRPAAGRSVLANQPFIDGTAPRVRTPPRPRTRSASTSPRALSRWARTSTRCSRSTASACATHSAWESLWFEHGLYANDMVAARWTPDDIAREMAAGRIWLATLEPSSVLRLHGLCRRQRVGAPEAPARGRHRALRACRAAFRSSSRTASRKARAIPGPRAADPGGACRGRRPTRSWRSGSCAR